MRGWWHIQPWWVKRTRLFLAIVWRQDAGGRLSVRRAWRIASIMHRRRRED